MHPLSVLKRPIVSEKSTEIRESINKYSFDVDMAASKGDIKKSIETLYGVKVISVNTAVTRGKIKRRGMHLYKQANVKKAVVTLEKGNTLPIFEEQ